MSDPVHIIPADDLIAHDIETENCVCGPLLSPIKREDGSMDWVAIHYSLDGREYEGER